MGDPDSTSVFTRGCARDIGFVGCLLSGGRRCVLDLLAAWPGWEKMCRKLEKVFSSGDNGGRRGLTGVLRDFKSGYFIIIGSNF